MADGTFMVKTDEVLRSVESIRTKMQEFSMATDKLYSEAETLGAQWKGGTSDAFNADLEGYKDVISRMQSTLDEYCNGVSTAMNTYASVDDTLADEVRSSIGAGRRS